VTDKDDCQRQGGRVLALEGMVNVCELLINVVRTNKLKTLISLNQKVRGEVWRASPSRTVDKTATGEQAGPKPSVGTYAERGKPTRLPRGKANRKASRWACGYGRMEKANAKL
jgi:hypothetical protein